MLIVFFFLEKSYFSPFVSIFSMGTLKKIINVLPVSKLWKTVPVKVFDFVNEHGTHAIWHIQSPMWVH